MNQKEPSKVFSYLTLQSTKPLISLENIDFTNQKQILNSPRSLEACTQLGVSPDELYFRSFPEFVAIHPEVLFIEKELQRYRYDKMEEYRKKTISVVKEKRNQLIQDKESQSVRHNNSTRDRSSTQAFSMENRIDGIIMNERRAIEKIKQR